MTAETFGLDPAYRPDPDAGRRATRVVGRIVILVVALNVLLLILTNVLDPRVDGPPGSSWVTTDNGVAAWRDVLLELDVDARRLNQHLADSDLLDRAGEVRLVILEPDFRYVDDRYRRAVRDFVAAGGTLVTTAGTHGFLGLPGTVVAAGHSGELAMRDAVTDLAGVERIAADARITSLLQPVVRDDSGRTLVGVENGVVVLADVLMVSNQGLGMADNGVLAVRLAGDGPIYFDEFVHGFGIGQGLRNRSVGWISLVLVTAGALIWMWGSGARFGPPVQDDRLLPPPRAAYLDGLAAGMARTTPTEQGFGVLRARAEHLLESYARRFGDLPPAEAIERTAATLGITDEEFAAVRAPITDHDQARAVAAVAAKIERARMENT